MKKYSVGALKERFSALGISQIDIAEAGRRDISASNSDNKERVLRAVSWLSAAERQRSGGNLDMQLMCAFVAFNALYAIPPKQDRPERSTVEDFIGKILQFDKDKILLDFVKKAENELVNPILAHQYLFRPYWNFSSKGQERSWSDEQEKQNAEARDGLAGGNAAPMLNTIYDRVRVLRNQILHGEAGCGDYYNRSQVSVCARFMPQLVGRMTAVIMDNFNESWGVVPFAPQGGGPDMQTNRPYNLLKE